MHLDSDQQVIAAHRTGNALVLAGAGSGKTACVTVRAANRLTRDNLPSSKLLLLTFTNKACNEMAERLGGLLEGTGKGLPLVSTFHSFGYRVIRKNPAACHRKPNPSVLDPGDAEKLFKEAMRSVGIAEASAPALFSIDMIRNAGLDPFAETEKDEIYRLLEEHGRLGHQEWPFFLEALKHYELLKQAQNVIDFDDQINLPIQALREHPSLRARINLLLEDITVDEAQDNNMAQYKLLKLLAGKTVVMVGDDDQSIHRWRGAHPDGLKQFKEDFQASTFCLERNYRSRPTIVDSATTLIRHNSKRLEKSPYAVKPETQAGIPCHIHKTGDVMAERIARDIKGRIDKGTPADQISILYRTNAMAKALEPSLLKYGIPYRIRAGTEMMEYKEVKILMAAARIATNPLDAQAFSRVAELVPGLGGRSIEKMQAVGGDKGILEGLSAAPYRLQGQLSELKTSLQSLNEQGPGKLLAWAVGPGKIKDWMSKEAERAVKSRDKSLEGDALKEAINTNLGYRVARLKLIQGTVKDRLSLLPKDAPRDDLWAEAMDMFMRPPDEDPQAPAVILSTAHGSKGLQWNTVHIAGFSEGLMPFEREGEIQNLTEERCLAYVAMTRAEENLILHHPKVLDLKMGGGLKELTLSRFVSEARERDPESVRVLADKTRRRNNAQTTRFGRIMGRN